MNCQIRNKQSNVVQTHFAVNLKFLPLRIRSSFDESYLNLYSLLILLSTLLRHDVIFISAGSNLLIRIQHRSTHARGRYGLVEIRRSTSEAWGSICVSGWDNIDSTVLCNQLGFERGFAIRYNSRFYGVRTGPYWLTNLACGGGETSILNCPNAVFRRHSCRINRPASVYCYRRRQS